MTLEPLDWMRVRDELPSLMAMLSEAVEDGASVGFLAPLDRFLGEAYWRDRCREVAQGRRIVLVAREGEVVVGSVQLALAAQQNGAHRGEVERLLVRRVSRGRGVGTALMREIENIALDMGRTLLLLNTRADDATEELFQRLGYARLGTIPEFARNPDGSWNTTAIMFKHLSQE